MEKTRGGLSTDWPASRFCHCQLLHYDTEEAEDPDYPPLTSKGAASRRGRGCWEFDKSVAGRRSETFEGGASGWQRLGQDTKSGRGISDMVPAGSVSGTWDSAFSEAGYNALPLARRLTGTFEESGHAPLGGDSPARQGEPRINPGLVDFREQHSQEVGESPSGACTPHMEPYGRRLGAAREPDEPVLCGRCESGTRARWVEDPGGDT